MVPRIIVDSSDIENIAVNLKRKGFQLNEISYSINGFAIANVSRINPDDNPDDFEPSYYTVIIDVRTKECCKFDFYGHKTDGIKIFAKPQKGRHFIFDPCFDIKFISTIDGESTPYILVSYLDYDPNYKSDKDDYEGFIYTQIFTVSNNNLNFRSSRKFKFEDCSHYKNSVEVCLVDIESSCIFAYKQLSKCEYDSEYDIKREHMYDFDGVWNTSLYCTDKRIIPLEDEDFLLDVVSNLKCEIEEQIRKDQEQEEFERGRNLD